MLKIFEKYKKVPVFILLFSVLAFSPLVSFGAVPTMICDMPSGAPGSFKDFVCILVNLAAAIIPLLAALAFLAFLWGLAKFILKAGQEKERDEGKQVMLWGIIAIFVLVSIFGILLFLYSEFELGVLETRGFPKLPSF